MSSTYSYDYFPLPNSRGSSGTQVNPNDPKMQQERIDQITRYGEMMATGVSLASSGYVLTKELLALNEVEVITVSQVTNAAKQAVAVAAQGVFAVWQLLQLVHSNGKSDQF